MQLTIMNIKIPALVDRSLEMRIGNKGDINSKYLNLHLVSAFLCLTLHSQFRRKVHLTDGLRRLIE